MQGHRSYAKIIVDISAEAVDRAFTYEIPMELKESLAPGSRVRIPFGTSDREKTGYVTEICSDPGFDPEKIKPITGILKGSLSAEDEMIDLALFMSRRYGSTLNAALKAALPVKRSYRKNRRRTDPVERINELSGNMPKTDIKLNPEQEAAYQGILSDDRDCLLYGVTGSGKTMVYIRLIEEAIRSGKRAIVLIPEISLTYQTIRQLSAYFSDRISVFHSRLSDGERYEQYLRAKNGEVDLVVGPRSAVFTPLPDLGLIIMDEEHERAYHSDISPRYDTREVASYRAKRNGAKLLLGSATPSLETYDRALRGEIGLYRLTERAVPGALLPKIRLCDMRRELRDGNRSIFSRELKELIQDRLLRREQIMLFLNRRGYGGFVSCRSCGYVVKCPHCDISLTAHNEWYYDRRSGKREARLSCHYCGHEEGLPRICPSCGSPYIAVFGTGTQKLEQAVRKEFPEARLLRMDADTTRKKGDHERILSAFAAHKADILIGTQMIVKGHDFPDVTLVGIVAADLSLNTSEFDASERTFQLITQASGRSGRGRTPGDVVIQSYEPENYAIMSAANSDYEAFFQREMSFRRLLCYPPVCRMLCIRLQSPDEKLLTDTASRCREYFEGEYGGGDSLLIGPCNASPYKVNDIYRKNLYIKQIPHDIMAAKSRSDEDPCEVIIKLRDSLGTFIAQAGRGRVQASYELF